MALGLSEFIPLSFDLSHRLHPGIPADSCILLSTEAEHQSWDMEFFIV